MKNDRKYASVDEIEVALCDLSDADLLRLDEIARIFIFKSDISIISPENLLKESVNRALNGTRKWPKDIDFVVFLKNAIRSISSEYRGKESRVFRKLKADESSNLEENALEKIINGENQDERKELYKKLWDDFEGDETVLEIFLGYEEGLKGQVLRDSFDISNKDYDSALKRINRYRSKLPKE